MPDRRFPQASLPARPTSPATHHAFRPITTFLTRAGVSAFSASAGTPLLLFWGPLVRLLRTSPAPDFATVRPSSP